MKIANQCDDFQPNDRMDSDANGLFMKSRYSVRQNLVGMVVIAFHLHIKEVQHENKQPRKWMQKDGYV